MAKIRLIAGIAVLSAGLVTQFGPTVGAATQKSSEPVTLQMLSLPSNSSGLQTGWWANILEKQIGVKLNIIPAGNQGDQKLQALMASGQLPDIVIFHNKQQVEQAAKAHLLVNLDQYRAELPNVFNYAAKAARYEGASVGNGQGLYAVPNQVGPVPVGAEPNWGFYIRWDLYKKLGMPKLKNMQALLPLLKKMQQLEPTTPTGQKTYGFTFWKDWDSINMQQAETMADIFGYDDGDQLSSSLPFFQVNLSNGKTQSILASNSEYINVLKLYYAANQMGLVDPDSLTQNYPTASSKAQNGQILFGWWSWFTGQYNTPKLNNTANPLGVRPIFPADAKVLLWGNDSLGSPWAFAIGASTQNLQAALKYLNFMYSPTGLEELFNGPKGITWNVNSHGKASVTKQGWTYLQNPNETLPGGGTLGEGTNIVNSFGISPTFIDPKTHLPISMSYWPSVINHDPTRLQREWTKSTGFKTTVDMLKAKHMNVTAPIAFQLIPTMPTSMQQVVTEIGQVVEKDSWLAVFASNQSQFNQYIQQMQQQAKGLGIQKVLHWDSQAWKQAQATAKKYQ